MSDNKPTLYAYTVRDRGQNRRAVWTRIGAAWPHEKGEGFMIILDATPLDGRIVLTEPRDEERQDAVAEGQKRLPVDL